MVTQAATSGKAAPRSRARTTRKATRSAAKPADAIKLLKDDHRQLDGWFKDYEKLEDDGEKAALVAQICQALTVHAAIEEEIFYPAAREAIGDDDLLDEAEVEHGSAKAMIAELLTMTPEDRLYDAKVKVLGEYISHHVEEEEGEMFPEARDSDMDLKALGQQLAARKAELMAAAGAS